MAEASSVDQHSGSGPVTSRQEGPHAHCIVISADDRFAFSADLGADSVFGYRLDYDAMAQVSRRRLPGSRTSELSLRHYHSEELSVLLRNNGFTQIRLTADHLARALSAGAHTLVVSAMPRPC